MSLQFCLTVAVASLPASALAAGPGPAAPLPAGYRLVYEQHFDSPESLRQFAFTDAKAWQWSADGESQALELVRQSRYEPKVRSPFNIALISDRVFGDFVLEVDLVQTGKEYGHRDMCIFYGVQDATHFYYTHLATKADPNAHNTFIVNDAPRKNFAKETTSGVNWGLGVWHLVRLERRIAEGTIHVFFDDMAKPVMVAEDRTFGAGWIGFGSFDDTGKVDSVRIWSPNPPEVRTANFFSRPE
jgi:hypothetical protein